jgi:hypothetical protein
VYADRTRRDAVKRTKLSIAGLMVLVVALALDCLAVRSILDSRDVFSVAAVFLGLPMATILLVLPVLLLVCHGRQYHPRPFLVGFEIVGWTVLTVLIAACWLTSPVNGFLGETIRQNPYPLAIHGIVLIVLFTTPQLFVAMLGGLVTQRYRVVVERRSPPVANPG